MSDYKRNADGTWTMKINNYERTLDKGGRVLREKIDQGGVIITKNYSNGKLTGTSYDGPNKKVK